MSLPTEHFELRPAVFLDRDGVLNRDSDDFIRTPDELVILPGVPEAVSKLSEAGFALIVITNQSGVARGLFTEEALAPLHEKLLAELAPTRIDGIYYCPHGPDDGCTCRKPASGMLLQAAEEHGLDLHKSYVVGDRASDITCGRAVGCRAVLVLTGKTAVYDPAKFDAVPDFVAADLTAAADWILADPDQSARA